MNVDEVIASFSAVAAKAAIAANAYFEYIDFDDLNQENLIWLVTHVDKVNEWIALDDEDQLFRLLYRSMERNARKYGAKEMDKYWRGHKAAEAGYSPRDEEFYSPGMVGGMILDLITDDRIWIDGRPIRPDVYAAKAGDFRDAWRMLSRDEQWLMERRYADYWDEQKLADELGISQPAVSRRLSRLAARLVDALGGFSPYEGPGSRRAISNAAARQILGGTY